ncbi:hypothetical protein ACIXHM_10900 [Bacteroides fragilis]
MILPQTLPKDAELKSYINRKKGKSGSIFPYQAIHSGWATLSSTPEPFLESRIYP